MRILIVGSGGREHALAWKVAQSPHVDKVYVVPGNAGTEQEFKVVNVNIDYNDLPNIVRFAKDNYVDLVIPGPEEPLVNGLEYHCLLSNVPFFGPSKTAARLEGSKLFAKEFMTLYNIPTADYAAFNNEVSAVNYVKSRKTPIVIKANGLAAGKGVTIAKDINEAIQVIQQTFRQNFYGEAGRILVIEEYLEGEEVSFICMVDGEHILPLATSQDHKAVGYGDTGANTGGMGAYSPAPCITEELHEHIMKEIVEPTVQGMKEEGNPYTGFLYVGLMITPDGTPKVLEYNCRLGDPETQPLIMRLKSDLVELCLAGVNKKLDKVTAEWDPQTAIGVVLSSGGYPGKYSTGFPIYGLERGFPDHTKVFHAGTTTRAAAMLLSRKEVVTNGGRVLCVTSLGNSAQIAQSRAYGEIKKIHFNKMYYRSDIGYRAVAREVKNKEK